MSRAVMDMSQYRDLFVSEARDHLSAFNGLIVSLEEFPGDKAAIDELFRHAHSLKGMAATMMYDPISSLAHVIEDQLSRLRSGEVVFIPALADLLLEGSDALAGMISEVESKNETITEAPGLVERFLAFDPTVGKHSCGAVEQEIAGDSAGRMQPPYQFRQTDSLKSIRIKTETLDHLVNITGELITNRYRLAECVRLSGSLDFDESLNQLSALLHDLRDEVLKARMVPFAFIAERFPRLVRDLARKQGKEITFHIDGKNIELDRGILEEIAEPLVHVLRNAVDHGMETADERVKVGKPYSGVMSLTAIRDKDHVEIVIADDGRGIDSERIKTKAVEKGLINAEQAKVLTHQEAIMLICSPGFSTAETISDISGRGVGMDAVRTVVNSLGGSLTISSEIGAGSCFVLRLPITVSIIHALIVQSGTLEIAFPINAVTRTLELLRGDIIDEAGQNMIFLDGARVPVRSLNLLLGQPYPDDPCADLLPAVVCDIGGTLNTFVVDRLCGQYEIFVRPLGAPLSSLRVLAGATITGDGRVIFVIDVASLVQKATISHSKIT